MPFPSPDNNPYHYSNSATKINDFLSGEREDQDDDKFQLASFKDQQGEQLSVSQRERGGERYGGKDGDALIKKEGDSRVGQTVLHSIIRVRAAHCQQHQQSALRSMVVL